MSAQEWLDRADALSAAATQGPWDVEEDNEAQEVSVRAGTARTSWETTASGVRIGTPAWSYNSTDVIYETDFETDGADEDDADLRQIAADAEFIAASRTLVPAMSAALRAVLDRHSPVPRPDPEWGGIDWCNECGHGHPCPTRVDITDVLDGA